MKKRKINWGWITCTVVLSALAAYLIFTEISQNNAKPTIKNQLIKYVQAEQDLLKPFSDPAKSSTNPEDLAKEATAKLSSFWSTTDDAKKEFEHTISMMKANPSALYSKTAASNITNASPGFVFKRNKVQVTITLNNEMFQAFMRQENGSWKIISFIQTIPNSGFDPRNNGRKG